MVLVLVLVMVMVMMVMMMMQPRTQALFCTPSCPAGKANMSFPSGQVMLMMIDGVCANDNNGVRNSACDVDNYVVHITLMTMVIILSLLAMLFTMMLSIMVLIDDVKLCQSI